MRSKVMGKNSAVLAILCGYLTWSGSSLSVALADEIAVKIRNGTTKLINPELKGPTSTENAIDSTATVNLLGLDYKKSEINGDGNTKKRMSGKAFFGLASNGKIALDVDPFMLEGAGIFFKAPTAKSNLGFGELSLGSIGNSFNLDSKTDSYLNVYVSPLRTQSTDGSLPLFGTRSAKMFFAPEGGVSFSTTQGACELFAKLSASLLQHNLEAVSSQTPMSSMTASGNIETVTEPNKGVVQITTTDYKQTRLGLGLGLEGGANCQFEVMGQKANMGLKGFAQRATTSVEKTLAKGTAVSNGTEQSNSIGAEMSLGIAY